MSGFITKSFESPDETRTPDKTTVEVVDLAGIKAARLTTEPDGSGPSASSRSSGPSRAKHTTSA